MEEVMNHFRDTVTKDLMDRIKSGEIDNSTPLSLPAEFRERLAAFIMERQREVVNERFVWFTYRVDEVGQSWVSWPIVGYNPIALVEPFTMPKVKKALTRINQRGTITAIRVIGKLPQHHYFDRNASEVI